MPVGTIVHNVEMKPGKGGQIARSAGTYVQVVGRDRGMVIVRLNSGEQRYIRGDVHGDGRCGVEPRHPEHQNFGKAGRNRWMGKRPLTRGVAKNPVDHPHGGGEGRTSGGRHPVTPVGQADQGRPHPPQQADGQDDHPFASREEEEVTAMARSVWKGPFVDLHLLKKAKTAQERGAPRADQDLVAPLDDPAAVRRPDVQRLQRPQVRSGLGQRGHGRPQARRVRAHAQLPGHAADKKGKR